MTPGRDRLGGRYVVNWNCQQLFFTQTRQQRQPNDQSESFVLGGFQQLIDLLFVEDFDPGWRGFQQHIRLYGIPPGRVCVCEETLCLFDSHRFKVIRQRAYPTLFEGKLIKLDDQVKSSVYRGGVKVKSIKGNVAIQG